MCEWCYSEAQDVDRCGADILPKFVSEKLWSSLHLSSCWMFINKATNRRSVCCKRQVESWKKRRNVADHLISPLGAPSPIISQSNYNGGLKSAFTNFFRFFSSPVDYFEHLIKRLKRPFLHSSTNFPKSLNAQAVLVQISTKPRSSDHKALRRHQVVEKQTTWDPRTHKGFEPNPGGRCVRLQGGVYDQSLGRVGWWLDESVGIVEIPDSVAWSWQCHGNWVVENPWNPNGKVGFEMGLEVPGIDGQTLIHLW